MNNNEIYQMLSVQLMRTCFLEYKELTFEPRGNFISFLNPGHSLGGWARYHLSIMKDRFVRGHCLVSGPR
jgi:hypothetical protein